MIRVAIRVMCSSCALDVQELIHPYYGYGTKDHEGIAVV